MLWRIVKVCLSHLKGIVIILIGFSTQAETNAFLPIVFHSPEKLERNKRHQTTQSGPIVAHTVTSRVSQNILLTDLTLDCEESIAIYFYSRGFFSDWISGFWSSPGKLGGQWARVVASGWRGQSRNDMQGGDEESGENKWLLWNKLMVFELRPSFWEKL